MNVDIPAAGSRGIAVLTRVPGGLEVVEVHVYAPNGGPRMTLPASMFPDVYADAAAVRRDVGKAIANNPVGVVIVDDIS